jgi:hypothetical protein
LRLTGDAMRPRHIACTFESFLMVAAFWRTTARE